MKILEASKTSPSNCDYEAINVSLWHQLVHEYPEQCKRVLGQDMCDIDPSFLGFMDKYYHLSKIIPLHFTIIDFGCAYAPQAYYFKQHRKYIGVDSSPKERFHFENTEHKISSIEEEVASWVNKPTQTIFAVCSYVPTDTVRLRRVFPNLFVYYPARE